MAWIVWVGGVDDHYADEHSAREALLDWAVQGYDDAQLEEILT